MPKHDIENRPLVIIGNSKTVIKRVQNKLYDARSSAQKLSVPMEWLIKVIPCAEIRHGDKHCDDQKDEYFWSVELITKLCHIKKNPYAAADVKYIATHCCKGNLKWANEIIDTLKSPMKYTTVNSEPSAYPLKSCGSNDAVKNIYPRKKR